MNKIKSEFVTECKNRVKLFKVDASEDSLYTLEKELISKAWKKTSSSDIPKESVSEVYAELIKISNAIMSSEIGASIVSGAKSFRYYIEQMKEVNDLRWHIEAVSDIYTLSLQEDCGYWITRSQINCIFHSDKDAKDYIEKIYKTTGVILPTHED